MFEGYVFFKIEKLTSEIITRLKKITGFVRILRENNEPTPFTGDALNQLKLFMRGGEHWGVAKVEFLQDQKVRAVSGFFQGLEGYVFRINHKRKTITIITSLTDTTRKIDVLYEEAEIVKA